MLYFKNSNLLGTFLKRKCVQLAYPAGPNVQFRNFAPHRRFRETVKRLPKEKRKKKRGEKDGYNMEREEASIMGKGKDMLEVFQGLLRARNGLGLARSCAELIADGQPK